MAKRYKELFRLKSRLYTEGSPVIIEVGALQNDSIEEKVLAQVKYRNLSLKKIVACKVDIEAYDIYGNSLEGVIGFNYLDLNATTGSEFGSKVPIYLPDNTTRKFAVKVRYILYDDDSSLILDDADWIPVPTQNNIDSMFKDAELVKQYELEVGGECSYYPEQIRGLFLCTCGTANLLSNSKCYKCNRSFKSMLDALDIEELKVQLMERLDREQAEREALQLKMANIRKKRIKLACFVLCAVLLCTVGYTTYKYISPMVRYKIAGIKYDTDKYESAYEIYLALGDYKDSREKAVETLYAQGEYLMEIGQFKYAANSFDIIRDYKDSKEKANECRNEADYLLAIEKYESKNYEEAIMMLEELGDYKDAEDCLLKYKYDYAEICFEQGKYMIAYDYYKDLIDEYEDCKGKAVESLYQYGCVCIDNGKYDEAYETFKTLESYRKKYKDSDDKNKEAIYFYAKNCYDSKDYKMAVYLLKQIKGYKDAKSLLSDAKYNYSLQLIENENYVDAINCLKELKDYMDSESKILEAEYKYVLSNEDNTNENTYAYLKELIAADYQDSVSIYSNLYKWRVTLKALNTARDDYSTILTSVSRNSGYLQATFNLSGGPLDDKLDLTHTVIWPSGSVEKSSWYWNNVKCDSNFYIDWSNGLNYTGLSGMLTINVYNKGTGELLGSASVYVY